MPQPLARIKLNLDDLIMDEKDMDQIAMFLEVIACEIRKGEHRQTRSLVCYRYDKE